MIFSVILYDYFSIAHSINLLRIIAKLMGSVELKLEGPLKQNGKCHILFPLYDLLIVDPWGIFIGAHMLF